MVRRSFIQGAETYPYSLDYKLAGKVPLTSGRDESGGGPQIGHARLETEADGPEILHK